MCKYGKIGTKTDTVFAHMGVSTVECENKCMDCDEVKTVFSHHGTDYKGLVEGLKASLSMESTKVNCDE